MFDRIGVYHSMTGNLVGAGDPVRVTGAAVSSDLLPTLGVQPLIGRLFTDLDDRDGAPGTTILSYRFWQTQFGGDPAVVGRDLLLDGEKYIGHRRDAAPHSASRMPTCSCGRRRGSTRITTWIATTIGCTRWAGCATASRSSRRARRCMLRAAQTRQQFPKENANVDANVYRFTDDVSDQSRLLLYALCGAAGCVLLIACANLANLLLARALGRRRELAVRTAIGAGRERMIRQLLTESLLLAGLGGGLGVAVAQAAVPLLNRLVPTVLPTASPPTVDLRVLLFALALTAVTGVAFGLAPIVRLRGEADLHGLRDGAAAAGGQRDRLRSVLVIAEIVASVVLLVSAGLLMRALWTIQNRDPGFKSDGVLTLATTLPVPAYGKVSTREAFYGRVLSEVRGVPGVTRAAFVTSLPMGRCAAASGRSSSTTGR